MAPEEASPFTHPQPPPAAPADWMRTPWSDGPVNRSIQRWRKKHVSTIRYFQECVDWSESGKGSYSTSHGQQQAVTRTIQALMLDTTGGRESDRLGLLYWMGRMCAVEPERSYPEDPVVRQGRARTTIAQVVTNLFDRWARHGWLSVPYRDRPAWAAAAIEYLTLHGTGEIGPHDNWLFPEQDDPIEGRGPCDAQRDLQAFLNGYAYQMQLDPAPTPTDGRPEATKATSAPAWWAKEAVTAKNCVLLRILAACTDAVRPDVRAHLIQFSRRYNPNAVEADLRQRADALDDRDALDVVAGAVVSRSGGRRPRTL